jgi:hypothetical protein
MAHRDASRQRSFGRFRSEADIDSAVAKQIYECTPWHYFGRFSGAARAGTVADECK